MFPDSLKEAWVAASRELPWAQGVERSLNRVSMSIVNCSACIIALIRLFRKYGEQLAWSGGRSQRVGDAHESLAGHVPNR